MRGVSARGESGVSSPLKTLAYEASRAARRRRFSSAVALRARSTGVARASEIACCFAHLARSASDISRITSCPEATCALTCSSLTCRASCSRSVRVFATTGASTSDRWPLPCVVCMRRRRRSPRGRVGDSPGSTRRRTRPRRAHLAPLLWLSPMTDGEDSTPRHRAARRRRSPTSARTQ